jgi:hypothetical protein
MWPSVITLQFEAGPVQLMKTLFLQRLQDARLATRYAAKCPSFVLVLGMHRSGTSCVSRILNLMGFSLGDSHMVRMESDDGEIHWEPPSLIWINDAILARSGGNWHTPPNSLKATRRDYWRCRRFLWSFAATKWATFKDPRLCLTYPVWQQVLPRHHVVFCVRHPMNVARSLERRDGWALAKGLSLWHRYNEHLLSFADCVSGAYWVDFDAGSDSLKQLVCTIATDFGIASDVHSVEHYDPNSHHYRGGSDLPPDVRRLYDKLVDRCQGNHPMSDV